MTGLADWRIKQASKFGRIEHFAGEMLGVVLGLNLYVGHAENMSFNDRRIWSVILFIVWLVYFVSHKLEKKLYGYYGKRSQNIRGN